MKSSFHGSPLETGDIHGGEKFKVPDELRVTSEPGIEGMKIKPYMAKSETEGGMTTKPKASGMKKYDQE